METLKEFDLFIQFCLEHGGTLRNHKAFGEMASELRMKIETLEINRADAAPEENPDQLSLFNSGTDEAIPGVVDDISELWDEE